jgi:amino acid adenylation domain-containing protein
MTSSLKKSVTFPQLFEEQVAHAPGSIAVLDAGSMDYSTLNQRANCFAHFLIKKGIGPENIVALALPRSLEMIVAMLAVLKAGAAYMPLDPEYKAERMKFMLDDAKPSMLISTSRIAPMLQQETLTVLMDDPLDVARIGENSTANPSEADRHAELFPANAAYVIYTSGSTGSPKGVVVSHAGIASLAAAIVDRFGLAPHARVLQLASFGFDAAFLEILMAFASGGTLVLPPPGRLVGQLLADTIRSYQVTHAFIPPTLLRTLDPESQIHLDTLVVGGERCSQDLIAAWSRGRRMVNAYGPTETTVCATISTALAPLGQSTLGTPVPNTVVYVLDEELNCVAPGQPGEIYVAGESLARGYVNDAILTAERFVPDPYGAPGTRMYRTGDIAKQSLDGSLEFIGRADNQVKIRGIRVELGEIEETLRKCDEVKDAIVIAEDRPGVGTRIVAYVIPSNDAVTPKICQHRLASMLPYYMVPTSVVLMPSWPMTTHSKIDRSALPRPISERANSTRKMSKTEDLIANIWADVLGVERFDADVAFLELGGDSLQMMSILSRIRDVYDVDLNLPHAFEEATVASWARVIDARLSRQTMT